MELGSLVIGVIFVFVSFFLFRGEKKGLESGLGITLLKL